jgi:hypothetical protein
MIRLIKKSLKGNKKRDKTTAKVQALREAKET